MKKKLLFLFAMTLFLSGNLFAQIDINAGTYSFQRNGFAPTTMSNPITLIGASSDNVASAVIDLVLHSGLQAHPTPSFPSVKMD